jgi:hypothetical protein
MSAIFSIKVTPETSPLIQTMLFEKEYGWEGGRNKTIGNLEYPYLFVWDDYSICRSDHNNNHVRLLNFKEFVKWFQTGKVPAEQVNLKIGNKTVTITEDEILFLDHKFNKTDYILLANSILKLMKN